jgi:RNase P subunit RPR2
VQAKLPDINAAFVKYRTKALEYLGALNYNGATASLNNINALFPEEYKIAIDQKRYEDEVKAHVLYVCAECESETPYNKITLEEVANGLELQVLTNLQTSQVWVCPKCDAENRFESTRIKKFRREEPYYLKVVPPCPVRNSGVQNRLGFHQRFERWFYRYMEEIEFQLGLYRTEYAAMDNDDENEGVFDGDGDEE